MYGLGFGAFRHAMIGSLGGGANGALTTAWITATGETDTTIISALNTLETDLTTYGLTAKMKALYPFVGGTAAKHKFNFMDARDLDVAYRLVFSGGWTHSSTGALPNGTNAYADTKFNASTDLTSTSPYGTNVGISYYSRTNSNGTEVEMGSDVNLLMEIRTAGTTYARAGQAGVNSFSDANSLGFYDANRLNNTTEQVYKNGVLKNTSTISVTSYINRNVFLGAFNQGTPTFYTTKECSFARIGDGLSDTEASNLYTAIQAFQTTLSRQV